MLHEDWGRVESASGGDQPREPRAALWLDLALDLGLDLGLGRFGLAHAQQLLFTPALRESLEVAANGASHLVELTLLAHGRTFPANGWSPAR